MFVKCWSWMLFIMFSSARSFAIHENQFAGLIKNNANTSKYNTNKHLKLGDEINRVDSTQ